MGKGLIQLASTGLFVWAVIWWATRSQRRARKAQRQALAADFNQRLTEVEWLAVQNHERLNRIDPASAEQPPLRRVQ